MWLKLLSNHEAAFRGEMPLLSPCAVTLRRIWMLPKLFSTLPLTTYRLRKELMQRLGLEIHESGINVQAHQIEQLECKHYDRRLPKLGPLQSCFDWPNAKFGCG